MEENTVTEPEVTPLTEKEEEIAAIAQTALSLFENIFTTTFTEAWKNWTVQEQRQFRDVIDAYVASSSIVREKFDGDVWKGHSDGTVSLLVQSVRKQREGDTPGKKAKVLTPAEILAKRLGK